jgi:hypothetical protein
MLFKGVFTRRELLLGLAVLWAGLGVAWGGQVLADALAREGGRAVFDTPRGPTAPLMAVADGVPDAVPFDDLSDLVERAPPPPAALRAPPDVSLNG